MGVGFNQIKSNQSIIIASSFDSLLVLNLSHSHFNSVFRMQHILSIVKIVPILLRHRIFAFNLSEVAGLSKEQIPLAASGEL